MKAQMAKAPKKPDFGGVPGALVESLEGLDLRFGAKKISPYDAMLDQLSVATDIAVAAGRPLPGLKFADARAKPSVYTRAKLKGFKVAFAITAANELYVRIDGRSDAVERRRTAIKRILGNGPQSSIALASKLRADGDATADAAGVGVIMSQMLKSGEVVAQDGGTWKLMRK